MDRLKECGVGVRSLDDSFFDKGNKVCRMYTQKGVVDEDEEELCHSVFRTFECNAPNCQLEFDSLMNYEIHYNSCHRFTCCQCKKQLPSPHLLDLHVSEAHDSFFKAQAERKPMFKCFVEDCPVVSKDPAERRDHCIQEHKFPHNFRFDSSKRISARNKQKQRNKLPSENQKKEEQQSGSPSLMAVDSSSQDHSSPEQENKNKSKVKKSNRRNLNFGNKSSNRAFNWHERGKNKNKNHPNENTEKKLEMQELMETLPLATD